MDYVNFINTLFPLLFSLLGALVFHFVILGIVGIFFKRRFKQTSNKLKYAAVIPARNEGRVIENLIKSIRASDYPKDKLDIFLIAHNCTDDTALVGRMCGAHVYEYDNPDECTMGFALKYIFSKISEDIGISSYDGYIIFNADNVVSKDYFAKLNDAFVEEEGKSIITSFRNSKNFGDNIISAMYGFYFLYGCRFEAGARSVLGCSTRIQGTGYVIPSEIVMNGWEYVTLTEDWEFTADQLLKGRKILYCDDAVFYDEQPTSVKVMWRQRVRWARGHLLVFVSKYFKILKKLFSAAGFREGFSLYDFSVNILPLGIIGTALALFNFFFLLAAHLIEGHDIGYFLSDIFKSYFLSFCVSYVTVIASTFLLIILERKRIKNVTPRILLLSVLFFPFFVLISAFCDVAALFNKGLEWKTIPHKSNTSINDIEKE